MTRKAFFECIYPAHKHKGFRSGNRRNEVPSMGWIGSVAHSIERTFKIMVSLGSSRRGKPYVPIVVEF
jgi:hypothetical protein